KVGSGYLALRRGGPLLLASRGRPFGHGGSCRHACAPWGRGPATSRLRAAKGRAGGQRNSAGPRGCCCVGLRAPGGWSRSPDSVGQAHEDVQANGEEAVDKEAGTDEERPHCQVSAGLTSSPSQFVAGEYREANRCSRQVVSEGLGSVDSGLQAHFMLTTSEPLW